MALDFDVNSTESSKKVLIPVLEVSQLSINSGQQPTQAGLVITLDDI